MDDIKVNGIMLRAVDYLENDKILTLYTAERGKITAGIKGVKKAGAKLKFAAQPFCFAEYILAYRGGRYTVINAGECESFYDLRSDIKKYYAASAVCEALLALTEENDEDEELFSLCVHTLGEMCAKDEGELLLAFLCSALKCCGYALNAGGCAVCSKDLTDVHKLRFDMDGARFVCFDCASGVGVSGVTYNAVRRACSLPYDRERAAEGVVRALKLMREYILYKTDAKLTSLTEYINLT